METQVTRVISVQNVRLIRTTLVPSWLQEFVANVAEIVLENLRKSMRKITKEMGTSWRTIGLSVKKDMNYKSYVRRLLTVTLVARIITPPPLSSDRHPLDYFVRGVLNREWTASHTTLRRLLCQSLRRHGQHEQKRRHQSLLQHPLPPGETGYRW